eukprot:scaffold324175_cov52-Tisochrysis_lutea.AAC.1
MGRGAQGKQGRAMPPAAAQHAFTARLFQLALASLALIVSSESASCNAALRSALESAEGAAPPVPRGIDGAVVHTAPKRESEVDEVNSLLDAMHAHAAHANGPSYLALFAPGSVFMGTDPSERWALEEFKQYAGARFAKGQGWRYMVSDRHVAVRGDVAWFDEGLEGEVLGTCRGTGVAVRTATSGINASDGEESVEDGGEYGNWRIAQYSLTMAIRNEVAIDVANINLQKTNGGKD